MDTKPNPLLTVVRELVTAAGQRDAFEMAPEFHLRIPNAPYLPLVIESWPARLGTLAQRRISVAHYVEQNGDLCADPDVELTETGHVIACQQWSHYTVCMAFEHRGDTGAYLPLTDARATASVEDLCRLWAGNLRSQGFIAAAQRLRE